VGDGSLILVNRTLMMSIRRRAAELKAAGQSADAAAQTAQREEQARHPDWPRVNGIAPAARTAYAEAP